MNVININKLKLLICLLLYTYCITACTNSSQNNKNKKIISTNDTIYNMNGTYTINGIIISPPEEGSNDYPDLQFKYFYHDFTMNEGESNFPIIEKGLQNMGFKFPNSSLFNKRLKDIFNIVNFNVDSKNNRFVIWKDYIYYEYDSPDIIDFGKISPDEIFNDGDNYFESQASLYGLYFKKNINYIFDLSYTASFINLDTFELKQKVIPQLPPRLFHINNYIFNESKSSLTWLIQNDTTFVQSLFIDLGYTSDKKLDRWILDNRLNNETIYDFGKAFYYKRFDNTVKFNPEVFEVFEEKANPKYMKQLNYLFSSPNFRDEYDLTFEQKAELFARLMYSAEEVAYKNQTVKIVTKEYPYYPDSFRQYIGTFTGTFKQYIDEDEIYYKEFKRNNFYNLPNFEEYWQSGKNYIEMMTPPQREIEEG